jgi:malonate transporter
MTQTILTALLPIVFVVGLGLSAAHFGFVQKAASSVFADFVIRFSLPLALFGAVLKSSPTAIENGPYFLSMLAGLMIPYAIAFGIGWAVFRHDMSECAIQALACAFPSMAYSGVPVLEAVTGQAGLLAVVVGNLVTSLIMIPLTLVLIHIGVGARKAGENENITILTIHSFFDAVKQPLVWLPILAAALNFSGVHLPQVLDLSFDLIGKAAVGVALFTLGIVLYGQRLRIDRDVAFNSLMKNVGQPIVFFGISLLLGIHGASARELVLTGTIPTATTVAMIALKHGIYADEAAASTLVSTVGSVVTITLAIIFVEHLT